MQDLLINEGKAEVDTSDQHVTIKVVQEQGRDVREGSVIPDLTPIHYRPRNLPPVPKFPQNESILGKRWATSSTNAVPNSMAKRPRLDDVQETQEQDIPMDSVELDLQQTKSNESGFFDDSALFNRPQLYQQASVPNGYLQDQHQDATLHTDFTGARRDTLQGGNSRAPITPFSDHSAKVLRAAQTLHFDDTRHSRSPMPRARSSSTRKFKQFGVAGYESEIDDSQMSPRSKNGQLQINGSFQRSSLSISPIQHRQRANVPTQEPSVQLTNGRREEPTVSESDHNSAEQANSCGTQPDALDAPASSEDEGGTVSQKVHVAEDSTEHCDEEITPTRSANVSMDESKGSQDPTRTSNPQDAAVGHIESSAPVKSSDTPRKRKRKMKSTIGGVLNTQDSQMPITTAPSAAVLRQDQLQEADETVSRKSRISDASMIDSPGEQLTGELEAFSQEKPPLASVLEVHLATKPNPTKKSKQPPKSAPSKKSKAKTSKMPTQTNLSKSSPIPAASYPTFVCPDVDKNAARPQGLWKSNVGTQGKRTLSKELDTPKASIGQRDQKATTPAQSVFLPPGLTLAEYEAKKRSYRGKPWGTAEDRKKERQLQTNQRQSTGSPVAHILPPNTISSSVDKAETETIRRKSSTSSTSSGTSSWTSSGTSSSRPRSFSATLPPKQSQGVHAQKKPAPNAYAAAQAVVPLAPNSVASAKTSTKPAAKTPAKTPTQSTSRNVPTVPITPAIKPAAKIAKTKASTTQIIPITKAPALTAAQQSISHLAALRQHLNAEAGKSSAPLSHLNGVAKKTAPTSALLSDSDEETESESEDEKAVVKPKSLVSPAAARPDPTIRDASSEDEDEDEDSNEDG